MIKLFDEYYYIDFEAIETAVNLEIVQSGNTVEQQIKFVKYDVVKMMLETILTEREDVDEEIGVTASRQTSIPFKISFNTLLKNKIINKL
jgi:hypothetical protein